MTVYLVIFLPKVPYIHRIYIYIQFWPTLHINVHNNVLICESTSLHASGIAVLISYSSSSSLQHTTSTNRPHLPTGTIQNHEKYSTVRPFCTMTLLYYDSTRSCGPWLQRISIFQLCHSPFLLGLF